MRGTLSLLIAAALLAGCGGGGESSTTTATASSPPEAGEKSIEDFGSEAEGPERATLLGTFHGYLKAIAAEDDAGACSYLAAGVQKSLEQFVGRSRPAPCQVLLAKLLSPSAAAVAARQARGEVSRVRVQGDRAFIVYHAPGARLYQLTMAREGNQWKAATVVGSILVPSAATLGR